MSAPRTASTRLIPPKPEPRHYDMKKPDHEGCDRSDFFEIRPANLRRQHPVRLWPVSRGSTVGFRRQPSDALPAVPRHRQPPRKPARLMRLLPDCFNMFLGDVYCRRAAALMPEHHPAGIWRLHQHGSKLLFSPNDRQPHRSQGHRHLHREGASWRAYDV